MPGRDLLDKFMQSLRSALPTTWKSASWLLKLMIPISLSVALLQHWGVLAWIAGYLNPLFSMLGLPGESAVLFISGAAAGTYAGVAAMMSVHLTLRQATIVGIMILICHALPMECTVNHKTGSNFWRMGLLRIIMAFVAAWCLNWVLPQMSQPYMYIGAAADSSLAEVLQTWALSQLKVAVLVFLIIYVLMVIQSLIQLYSLLDPLSRFLAPLMRVFGLPRKAAYMWLVGNVLGLSYGSAVMLDLEEKGQITREDANAVNYHLIMNHSMLEDTIVMAVTGISVFWILATRLLFALIVVWTRKAMAKVKMLKG
jgi:spore maturation protein SpmB